MFYNFLLPFVDVWTEEISENIVVNGAAAVVDLTGEAAEMKHALRIGVMSAQTRDDFFTIKYILLVDCWLDCVENVDVIWNVETASVDNCFESELFRILIRNIKKSTPLPWIDDVPRVVSSILGKGLPIKH